MDQRQIAEKGDQKAPSLPIWVLGAGLQSPLSYLPPLHGPQPKAGSLVKVPLRRQSKMGIVLEATSPDSPKGLKLKRISEILRDEPLISPQQMKLCHFVADYYACSLEDSLQAALPPMAPKKTTRTWALTTQAQNALFFTRASN